VLHISRLAAATPIDTPKGLLEPLGSEIAQSKLFWTTFSRVLGDLQNLIFRGPKQNPI